MVGPVLGRAGFFSSIVLSAAHLVIGKGFLLQPRAMPLKCLAGSLMACLCRHAAVYACWHHGRPDAVCIPLVCDHNVSELLLKAAMIDLNDVELWSEQHHGCVPGKLLAGSKQL